MNWGKIIDVIDKIPVVNLIPLTIKIMVEFPSLWDSLPDSAKKELFLALVKAGTKAANDYSKRERGFL